MMKRFCEGGIEIDDGPCRKCGAMPKDRCGSPGPITHSITLDALEAKANEMSNEQRGSDWGVGYKTALKDLIGYFKQGAGRESE